MEIEREKEKERGYPTRHKNPVEIRSCEAEEPNKQKKTPRQTKIESESIQM